MRGTRTWHMVWGILVGWCALATPPPWVHGCTHRRWYIWSLELLHTSFLHAWPLLQLKIRTGRLAVFPWGIHGFLLDGCCMVLFPRQCLMLSTSQNTREIAQSNQKRTETKPQSPTGLYKRDTITYIRFFTRPKQNSLDQTYPRLQFIQ